MTHSHTLRVPLPTAEALHLFTPVGERAWAPGWDPVFPAGEQGDGGAPGTVEVRLRPDGEDTLADVTYVTTALNDEPFDPDLAHWEHAIRAALGAS